MAFTGMVQKSLSQCKRCSRSITSGQKTSNGVLRVLRALKSQKKARILKRVLSKSSVASSQPSVVAVSQENPPSPLEIDIISSQECAPVMAGGSSSSSSGDAAAVLAMYTAFPSSTPASLAPDTPKKKVNPGYLTPDGLVRFDESGKKSIATMSPGPKGFALATFPDSPTVHETEQPNISLPEAQATVLKRPAAAAAAASPSSTYRAMFYGPKRGWGIRMRSGARSQVVSIARSGADPEVLKQLAVKMITKA